MQTGTIEKVIKHSIVYGYAITQPFLLYINSDYKMMNLALQEAETQKYGENSKLVRHIHQKLSVSSDFENKMDGQYQLLTAHAVNGFQSSSDIEVTGQVDQDNMSELAHKEKRKQIKAIQSDIDAIQYGEKSNNVIKVQEVLHYYGYYTGNIDGIYGPLTEHALQQIKNEQLTIDEHKENAITQNKNEGELEKSNEKEVVQLNVHNQTTIIQSASDLIGTPYVWGGNTPNGFDCSGFIKYVYDKENKTIPRTVREIWNFANQVNTPKIGDLVFFETYQAGPSHVGIYLGNGDFIHAGATNGVEVSNLNNQSYWNNRYLGAKRIH